MSIFSRFTNSNMRTRRDPAEDYFAVSPNDSTDLPNGPCRALYIGVTGDVTVTSVHGNTVLFTGMLGGMEHAIEAARVHATGTDATGIVALY